jgi:hypothetical protein
MKAKAGGSPTAAFPLHHQQMHQVQHHQMQQQQPQHMQQHQQQHQHQHQHQQGLPQMQANPALLMSTMPISMMRDGSSSLHSDMGMVGQHGMLKKKKLGDHEV